jgi:hypothetical protein
VEATEIELLAVREVARAGTLPAGELAARLGLGAGGAVALIQRLEDHGWLVRDPHLRVADELDAALADLLAALGELAQGMPSTSSAADTSSASASAAMAASWGSRRPRS